MISRYKASDFSRGLLTHKRPLLVMVLVIVLCLIARGGSGQPQTLQPSGPASPPPNAALAPYMLTMGDMMNTLVQPRHAKLGLAGQRQNWPLAAYALFEIRQVFAGIVKAQPRFRGLPVDELVDAALSQPLNAIDAAIRQHDPQKFAAAYEQLSQGCNACHMELDHPFVVIKTPDASAFANQDFTSPR
ncbi:MAG TPA: hypothetical protein VGJ20_26905 [Xanthobacteraceae bacterium]|jgi:hypothetical protein